MFKSRKKVGYWNCNYCTAKYPLTANEQVVKQHIETHAAERGDVGILQPIVNKRPGFQEALDKALHIDNSPEYAAWEKGHMEGMSLGRAAGRRELNDLLVAAGYVNLATLEKLCFEAIEAQTVEEEDND